LLGKSDQPLQPFSFPIGFETGKPECLDPLSNTDSYIIVCAGTRAGDYYRGLGTARWINELRALEEAVPHSLVFTGTAAEAQSHEDIIAGLEHRERHVNLTGSLASLEQLLKALSQSVAYVGKDGGTMHLAAALRKPVLAVFGGGHWNRFFPNGTRACVLSVSVPCRGCDWRCHLPEPACATGLRQGALLDGWNKLSGLRDGELNVIEQAADPDTVRMLESHSWAGVRESRHSERRKALALERKRALNPLHRLLDFVSWTNRASDT